MGKIFDYDGVPVLHTTSGDLKGYFYDGVYIYKGIPYAYADRFQMPVPSKWDGVKDATNYGFVCPLQNQDTPPNGELMVPHRYWPQDEHCQSLNIWTNKLDPEAKNRFSYGSTAVDTQRDLPSSRLRMTASASQRKVIRFLFLSTTD